MDTYIDFTMICVFYYYFSKNNYSIINFYVFSRGEVNWIGTADKFPVGTF